MKLARTIRHVPDARASADFRAFAADEKARPMETGETVPGFAPDWMISRPA